VVLLGKALGGGIVPISAVVARREVIDTLEPGSHGSTFGGNPLACAVAREVIDMMASGEPQQLARERGAQLAHRLDVLTSATGSTSRVDAVRTIGLWAGIDLAPGAGTARAASEQLLRQGVLVKDTSDTTIRVAPPLTISAADLDLALDRIVETVGPLG
jgi:ornithine--oxo-acid transaminase